MHLTLWRGQGNYLWALTLPPDTQHRFGPQVMRLANLVAYDGLLKAGRAIRSHGDEDPEIVRCPELRICEALATGHSPAT
jgi:hypothetical protein